MNCPIDNTPLAITERQGIEIDYCPKCRGVWLDRGELDKIIERNAQYEAQSNSNLDSDYPAQQATNSAPMPPSPAPQGSGTAPGSGPDIAGIVGDLINKGLDKRRQQSQYGGHKKKKGGLLGELFDF